MNNLKDGLELLPRLYDAAYSKDNWRAALDPLVSMAGSRSAMLYMHDSADEIWHDKRAGSSAFSGRQDLIEEYNRRFISVDIEGSQFVHSTDRFRRVLDTDIWPGIDSMRNRPEVDYLREKALVFRRCIFNLSDADHRIAGLILHFGLEHEDVPLDSVNRITPFLPHLARALDIYRFTLPLRARYNAVLGVLDRLAVGICICTGSGHVLEANSWANRTLGEKDGIWMSRDSRLACRNPDDTAELTAAVRAMSSTAVGEGDESGRTILVRRFSTTEPLLVVAAPLRDAEVELEPELTGCVLTIVDPQIARNMDTAVFAEVNGFTGAEAEVADLLAQGLSNPEIADRREVAVSTISAQVKSILAKTSARSRTEFLWKLFRCTPPVL